MSPVAARSSPERVRRNVRSSSRPALEEAAGDLVANLHARDAATHLDHLTGAVGKRDNIIANRHPVRFGASIGSAAAFRISLPSYPSCTRCGSICICISRGSTPPRRPAKPCFK
jgi:hypothetical protein